MAAEDPAVKWLLESGDPSINYLTLTDILNRPLDSKEVLEAKKHIPNGPIVKTLLSGQQADGGFGVHPYQKWTGAHWRLVSLVELGAPSEFKPAVRGTNLVLKWLLGEGASWQHSQDQWQISKVRVPRGQCACSVYKLGLAEAPRVVKLAESLVGWQWTDGGWNCDRNPNADHSSVNESLSTPWGLLEYQRATGRSRLLEAHRERIGVLFTTSSLPFGPHGRNNSSGHDQTALSGVLALRYSPRALDTLASRKVGRPTDQG